MKFEAKFTSSLPYFVVDTDSDRNALAKALAREEWTKEFFEVLERLVEGKILGYYNFILIIPVHIKRIMNKWEQLQLD